MPYDHRVTERHEFYVRQDGGRDVKIVAEQDEEHIELHVGDDVAVLNVEQVHTLAAALDQAKDVARDV